MNVHRAQEILAADEKIEVDLNGLAVWIDSVDSGRSSQSACGRQSRRCSSRPS
jgi:H-type small acid-soluble spore protein